MSMPLMLEDLLAERGVVGAVSWVSSATGLARAAPPKLRKFVGFRRQERAERLMLTAEAIGLSVTAVLHLEAERREAFRTTELPVDAVVVHGQKYSLVLGLGQTAALVNNSAEYDINAISRKLALVQVEPAEASEVTVHEALAEPFLG